MSNNLSRTNVSTKLSNIPGRAIVSARGHYSIVDSPSPLGGPNEELNPLDLFLAALASCATFVCETAAQELNMPLRMVYATAEGNFDARGVRGDPIDPRIQAFRIELSVDGPSQEQAQKLVDASKQRCPIYTTLSRSVPIEITITLVRETE